jgi:hypothetical protein
VHIQKQVNWVEIKPHGKFDRRHTGRNPRINFLAIRRYLANWPFVDAHRFGLDQSNQSNASAAPITDGHLLSFDNYGNIAFSAGILEHRFKALPALLDIHIFMLLEGRPGPFRVGSARLTVYDYLRAHFTPPFSHGLIQLHGMRLSWKM